MPLIPTDTERDLIEQGMIPGVMLDASIAPFSAIAVIAAMELEVFDHLRTEPLDPESLADRTDSSRRGMEILLRALVPLGYLKNQNGIYELTNAAERSLPQYDIAYVGKFFKEQARKGLDAQRAVRDAPENGIIGWETVQSGDVGRGYQASMRWLARGLINPVVDAASLPTGAERMLDIGGSHGLYTVRFCETNPGLEGTILDWPIGLDAAQRTLDDQPALADRIELVERDFEQQQLPDGYDFAFLGNIIHGLSPNGNQELFQKLADSTTERGTIAILDQVSDPPMPETAGDQSPATSLAQGIPALLGFGLFLFSGGRSHSYPDLQAWLTDAGFPDVSYTPIRESPGFSVVTARKPGAD